ncbi:outer membrane protein assembly factor BamB family protein [Kitasatospora aureofaciens]|uniref:outer membrane protein assembly factor BamB family protein n=1 Tax=Kitasatospora aureofaciens TaxID=1894 RepID=UPI0036F465AC
MKSSEGPVQEASWQWDGEADDAAGAPGDVIGGGGDGPRLSRRGVLVGAGALALGGAAWAVTGAQGGGPGPRPRPTSVAGPTPLWTYRGPEAMTPERLMVPPDRPVSLSRAGLQVLDPADGSPKRLLSFDPPPPKDWPSDLERPAGNVAVQRDYLYTSASRGHLDARHLTDPAADWSLPLPDDLQGGLQLTAVDAGVLYGCVLGWPRADSTVPSSRLFAVRLEERSLLWSVAVDQQERPVAHEHLGNQLACVRSLGTGPELVVRDSATGRELWTAPGGGDLSWCTAVGRSFLVPDGSGGVRLLGADGKPGWTHSPARGESWRALPPVPDAVRVFVPRDDGVVTCLETGNGRVLWSCKLPFLLDRRSRPLLHEGTLYVPGPAAGGVGAIYAATGVLGWTFRDSGPGRDVWSLASDGERLYAGHDEVLHALPLT